ncbi:unnamed protein product [Microthlaspi erraticum]|uniref:Uncharacterized protein n=1 Tax=Microthlaspi erraticum TaxID=1685480 RepID=A0A6D2J349_9BRAS|nr:unnamed protein product [Microthlaspi erraticum]
MRLDGTGHTGRTGQEITSVISRVRTHEGPQHVNVPRTAVQNKENLASGPRIQDEKLKSTTVKMAEERKVLNTPGPEKQTKRELFDALRQELELQHSSLLYSLLLH